MNLSGMPGYIRKPTQTRDNEQQLVFTFPILIDTTVQKYEKDIRDFMAVAFLNNIKLSNFLQISSRILKDSHNQQQMNPAEFLYKHLNNKDVNDLEQSASSYFKYLSSDSETRQLRKQQEYQQYIYDKLQYIKEILKHDISLSKLNPYFTYITADKEYGMVTIPMIVGTKAYYTDLNVMYWILLIAISRNIKINSQNVLDTIKNLMQFVNPTNYHYLLFTDEGRKRLEDLSGIDVNSKENPIRAKEIQDQFQRNQDKFGKAFAIIKDDLIIKNLGDWVVSNFDFGGILTSIKDDIKEIVNTYDKLKASTNPIIKSLLKIKDVLLQDIEKNKKQYISIYAATQLSQLIQNESEKSLIFFRICLDRAKWDRYVGVNATNNQGIMDYTVNKLSPEFSVVEGKSLSTFSSFVTSNIISSIQLTIYAAESINMPFEIDAEMKNLSRLIITIAKEYNTKLWSTIITDLKLMFNDANVNNIDISENLKSLTQLNAIKLNDNENELQNSVAYNFSNQNKIFESDTNYITYINHLSNLATKFNTKNELLTNLLTTTFANEKDTINKQINDFRNNVSTTVESTYNEIFLPPSTYATGRIIQDHPQVHALFKSTYTDDQIIRILMEANRAMSLCITEMTLYFFLFSLISYIDEMINIVNVQIEIIKKDATDFPNYCIVLPYYLIEGFYHAKVADLFKKALYSSNPGSVISDSSIHSKIPKINQGDNKKIIDYISGLLDIPNIILIDEKTDTFYYKFMFMDGCQKTKLSSINTYIKTQKDILNL